MSKGSTEALIHLEGLRSVIALKGGLDTIQLEGAPLMIKTLDLLYAVMLDSQPVLTDTQRTQALDKLLLRSLSDRECLSMLTTLLISEQETLQQSSHSVYTSRLKGLPSLLHIASACLSNDSDDLPNDCANDSEAVETFRTSLVTFGQDACLDDPLNPDAMHLGRCCYFTASILFNVIVNRAPHRHMKNQELVEQVFDAIKRVKNGTWVSRPYLRLAVLLFAAVTTCTQHMKSFFKAELVRSIYQMGVEEWGRIETFILRFLDMKRVLERPERRLTVPLSMDTSDIPTSPVVAQPWHVSQAHETALWSEEFICSSGRTGTIEFNGSR